MDLDTMIANHLANLRKDRGLSLSELAGLSTVSKAMISKIERGQSSPTASILGKLAAGLGVPLAQLLADTNRGQKNFSRKAEQEVWQDPATGYRRRQVSESDPANGVELVEIELPEGALISYPRWGGTPYRQKLWLIDGELEVRYGNETFMMEAGDRLDFGVDRPLSYKNLGNRACRYLLVLVHE